MPSLKDLRYRAEYAALRLVVALVRAVPLDVGVDVSAKAWRLIARFDRRHQRALDNLAIAFPREERCRSAQAIALAMWENLGRVMAETMQIDRILAEPDAHRDRQPEHLPPLQGQARRRHRRDPAHGQLGAGDLAVHAGRQQPRRRLSHGQEPLRRPVPARGRARSSIPAACWARGATREEGQTTARAIMDFVRDGRPPGPRVRSARPHRACRCRSSASRRRSVAIPAMIARRRRARASGCRAACASASRAASRSS